MPEPTISHGYTSGEQVDHYRDRASVYSAVNRAHGRPGMISRTWFAEDSAPDDIASQAIRDIRSNRHRKNIIWCAENAITWEVVTSKGSKDMIGKMTGVHGTSVDDSFKRKRIVKDWFFYPQGNRPSEDEIDDMLDYWEARKDLEQKRKQINLF